MSHDYTAVRPSQRSRWEELQAMKHGYSKKKTYLEEINHPFVKVFLLQRSYKRKSRNNGIHGIGSIDKAQLILEPNLHLF